MARKNQQQQQQEVKENGGEQKEAYRLGAFADEIQKLVKPGGLLEFVGKEILVTGVSVKQARKNLLVFVEVEKRRYRVKGQQNIAAVLYMQEQEKLPFLALVKQHGKGYRLE